MQSRIRGITLDINTEGGPGLWLQTSVWENVIQIPTRSWKRNIQRNNGFNVNVKLVGIASRLSNGKSQDYVYGERECSGESKANTKKGIHI